MDEIGVTRNGVVTTFTIQRPEAKNSLSTGAAHALKRAFRAFEADDAAKEIIMGIAKMEQLTASRRARARIPKKPVR